VLTREHWQRTAYPPDMVSRLGAYRHGGAAWRWWRRGGLTALGGKEGGWWPAAAPVSFYITWEGRRSIGTSQLKKKSTRGGAQ
jgi:hypothetical protein